MLSSTLTLATAALLIEAIVGYPAWLFRLIGHPVTWMGALLKRVERRFNRPDWPFGQRRVAGLLTLAILLLTTGLATIPIARLGGSLAGFVAVAIMAASLPAQRSLATHVKAVADALDAEGLTAGRAAVSMIVGRNPAYLDAAGVVRAAIESLAENFSDGVVAPAFWLAVGGLPAGALYKAANTADSMIGHRSERYAAYGWAAARFDDLVNLPASRLSALWLVLAALGTGEDWRRAVRTIARDAARHRSPNAGWPEAALAGALDMQLGGPRVYGDTLVDDAAMGQGRSELTASDIRRALRLYRAACAVQGLFILVLAAAARL